MITGPYGCCMPMDLFTDLSAAASVFMSGADTEISGKCETFVNRRLLGILVLEGLFHLCYDD